MSMFEVRKVTIGPETMTSRIEILPEQVRMTSEDLEGTNRVLNLLPQISQHACVSPNGRTFGDDVSDTSVVHLLEHVTAELLKQTERAGDVVAGRTVSTSDDRVYELEMDCLDDTLCLGALSSAAWILDWAYNKESEPVPNIEGIVGGLVSLINSIDRV